MQAGWRGRTSLEARAHHAPRAEGEENRDPKLQPASSPRDGPLGRRGGCPVPCTWRARRPRRGGNFDGTSAARSVATAGGCSIRRRRGWAGGGAVTERMRGGGPALGRLGGSRERRPRLSRWGVGRSRSSRAEEPLCRQPFRCFGTLSPSPAAPQTLCVRTGTVYPHTFNFAVLPSPLRRIGWCRRSSHGPGARRCRTADGRDPQSRRGGHLPRNVQSVCLGFRRQHITITGGTDPPGLAGHRRARTGRQYLSHPPHSWRVADFSPWRGRLGGTPSPHFGRPVTQAEFALPPSGGGWFPQRSP